LKRKVEAMHAGQAKVALLKNQAQDAQAALSGAGDSFFRTGFTLALKLFCDVLVVF
jgi:hypothetical protein